jgi:hypothetical protein
MDDHQAFGVVTAEGRFRTTNAEFRRFVPKAIASKR